MSDAGDPNDEATMQRKHGLWQQAVAQTERVLRWDAHMTAVGGAGSTDMDAGRGFEPLNT